MCVFSRIRTTVLLVMLSAAGCARRPTPVVADPALMAAAEQLQGQWVVSLSDNDARRLTVLKLSQQSTVPGEPELRSMGLQDADLALLDQLRGLPLDDPQREVIADTVARMGGRALLIEAQTMTLSTGARARVVQWSLQEQQGDRLYLSFVDADGVESTGQIQLKADGSLVFVDTRGEQLVFERAQP